MISSLSVLFLTLITRACCLGAGPAGPTQHGTISTCDGWYTVKHGDTCSSVEAQFQISHESFIQWNPAVSKDCSKNFWEKYAYCVRITPNGQTSVVPTKSLSTSTIEGTGPITSAPAKGSILMSSSAGIASGEMPRYRMSNDSLPRMSGTTGTGSNGTTSYSVRNPIKEWKLSSPTIDTTWPPKKTQEGQPSYCNKWHFVSAGDTCDTVYQKFGTSMSKADLQSWNPAIGSDCSGLRYSWWVCVGVQPQSSLTLTFAAEPGNATVPPYSSFTPAMLPAINSSFIASPTQPGLATACNAFHQAATGDSCSKVLDQFNYISQQQFFQWNPALKENCNGLIPDYWYCVADFDKGNLPMPPTITQAPSAVPKDTAKDCVSWYWTTGSDTCDTMAAMFGTFSSADIIKWNPAVWSDCSNIQDSTWYCVAVPDTPTARIVPLASASVDSGTSLNVTSGPAITAARAT